MLKKYKTFNESLLNNIKGPSEEEVKQSYLQKFNNSKITIKELLWAYEENNIKYTNQEIYDILGGKRYFKEVPNTIEEFLDKIIKQCEIEKVNKLITKYIFDNNDIIELLFITIKFQEGLKIDIKSESLKNILSFYLYINYDYLYDNYENKINNLNNIHMSIDDEIIYYTICDALKNNDYIKESLLDKIEGPNEEEFWNDLGFIRTFDNVDEFFDYLVDDAEPIDTVGGRRWYKGDEPICREDVFNKLFIINMKYYNIMLKVFFNDRNELELHFRELLKKYPLWKKYKWVTYGNID